MAERDIDPRDLRRAFGTFATGVTIVTTLDEEGSPWGFTANSFTSVSLDPPLALICIAKTAGSCPVFEKTSHFAINILAESQRAVSGTFAAPGPDKFSTVAWSGRATGSPIIDGVVAWLDCAMHEVVDAGDHYILIGRVLDYAHFADSPLGYCRGAYVSFGLAQEAQHAQEAVGTVQVGALVERGDAILFYADPDSGALKLPMAGKLGSATEPKSLLGRLAAAGVMAQLPFLYAVYDRGERHIIIYRGEVDSGGGGSADAPGLGADGPSAPLDFIPFDQIPWERIQDPSLTSMLKRYAREKEDAQFGLYVGDGEAGNVHRVGGDPTPSKI